MDDLSSLHSLSGGFWRSPIQTHSEFGHPGDFSAYSAIIAGYREYCSVCLAHSFGLTEQQLCQVAKLRARARALVMVLAQWRDASGPAARSDAASVFCVAAGWQWDTY
eukprot:754852-Hanusia_phi.AAC.1